MSDVHMQNVLAMKELSPAQIREHMGEYALFVQGRVMAYFGSNREALHAALADYTWGEFSVLRVEQRPVEVGFFDCADGAREAQRR